MLDKVNLQNTINWRNILLVRVMYKIACRICLYRPATFLPCHHQAG